MAKQNKGRKLFATTATAALVASAIVPVASAAEVKDFDQVPAWAKDAVKYLVDNGSVQGDENGNFKPFGNLTRAQAAEILTKELKLEATGTEDFSDVAEGQWFYKAVVATSPEIFNGNEKGEFQPNANLTRQEAAKVLVQAYGLTGSASLSTFADAASVPGWSKSYLETAVATGVINGKNGKLAPTDKITNAEFATMVKRAIDAAVTNVASVSAVDNKTLKIEGTGLKDLKAEDLTVAGNKVLTVTPAADGKSATVALEGALIPNQEYTLTWTVDGQEKTFKFQFGYVVTSVSVDAVTVDDDTKFQKVPFKVNGQAANLDALTAAGYSVSFKAVDASNTDVTAAFFDNAATGAVKGSLTIGDYKVQVTVTRGSSVVVSEVQTVKVRNVQAQATAINSYELTNSAVADKQISTTLVVGETAQVTKINVTANNDKTNVTDTTKYSVTSSASGIISVNPTTGVLTAHAPGTATITIKYGDVTKAVTFTVSNTARQTAKVDPYGSSVTLVKTAAPTQTVYFDIYDQYGDLVKAPATINVAVPGVATAAAVTTDASGTGSVALTYAAAGTGTLYFQNAAKTTLGSIIVKSSATNTVASQKLEVVKAPADPTRSDDSTLDVYGDYKVKYNLNNYTSENVAIGAADLTGYSVKYNADIIKVGTSAATGGEVTETLAGTDLDIQAKVAGSTELAVYNTSNILVAKLTITVTDSEPEITGVTFKSVPTVTNKASNINVGSVLTLTTGAVDDLVSGITLSKSTMHATRIVKTGADQGKLYIDLNDNGSFDATDDVVGKVTLEKATDFTGGAGAIADIYTGHTTATTAEQGTLVFKVLNEAGTKIIASTSVTVDVK